MKSLWKAAAKWSVAMGVLGLALMLRGCQSGPTFAEMGTPGPAGSQDSAPELTGNVFQVGDLVMVTFSGIDPTEMPPHSEKITESGCINLQYIGQIKAAGKTAGQLQWEIQTNYVPKYFQNLSVTVVPPSQVYYVGGEVKSPGAHDYLGKTDIIEAIQAAGDFTDFANKKKVKLTRKNGHQETINVTKILNDSRYDVPVYPGDQINVPRRKW